MGVASIARTPMVIEAIPETNAKYDRGALTPSVAINDPMANPIDATPKAIDNISAPVAPLDDAFKLELP